MSIKATNEIISYCLNIFFIIYSSFLNSTLSSWIIMFLLQGLRAGTAFFAVRSLVYVMNYMKPTLKCLV